jgi:hypothetical protein
MTKRRKNKRKTRPWKDCGVEVGAAVTRVSRQELEQDWGTGSTGMNCARPMSDYGLAMAEGRRILNCPNRHLQRHQVVAGISDFHCHYCQNVLQILHPDNEPIGDGGPATESVEPTTTGGFGDHFFFTKQGVCVVVRKGKKKYKARHAISYYVISLHQLNKRSLNNFLENAQTGRSFEVGCVGLENLRRTVIASTVVCVRIVCQCACAR